MKALVLETADGPDSVALRDQPAPVLADGAVRVALRAAALNHRELWICRGQYPGMKLFYKLDKPLMSPSDVLALNPSPLMVMYQ